jgi:hypothetical protein
VIVILMFIVRMFTMPVSITMIHVFAVPMFVFTVILVTLMRMFCGIHVPVVIIMLPFVI